MEGKAIYAALLAVQQKINVPKGRDNDFGHYKYRNVEDIIAAAKPLLQENGLALLMTDVIEKIGDRYYLKATAKLIDIATGDSIENTAYAREPLAKKGMDDMQVTGSCSTYARRYALNGLFAIDVGTLDPDSNEYREESEKCYRKEQEEARKAAGGRSGGNAGTYTNRGGNGPQTGAQAQDAAYDKRTLLHRITEEMQRTSASSAEVSAITQEKYGKSGAKVMNEIELKDLADNFETYLAEMMQKKAAS